MLRKPKLKIILFLALGVTVLALTACAQNTETPPTAPAPLAATTQVCPEQTPCPELPETVAVPFEELWKNSPHADKGAMAFRDWDEENPPEVPTACARCHSSGGYLDYIGADGSEMFVVDKNASVDTVIDCKTCHNDVTMTLSTVKFPSGVELTGLGHEATCMTCHQGRESKVSVDEAITVAGVEDDAVSAELSFVNIHYDAAAVSHYGTMVKGGYEYDGMSYDPVFEHVQGVQACQDCHNPHSLELKIETCGECHSVSKPEDFRNVREPSSLSDYDGDGDMAEGIFYEIDGLKTLLNTALQRYSQEVIAKPIAYDSERYPYFFNDTNSDGELADDEAAFPNSFASWSPRLLKAAYNLHLASKDKGGYAHGGKYIIELLHDSIADLNTVLKNPVSLETAVRTDPGHFASSNYPWHHWDAGGVVPNTCSKCHTAPGLPQFLKEGLNTSQKPSSGLWCETCHNVAEFPAVYAVDSVTFPSGAKLGFDSKPAANICIECHQGLESTVSVNKAIGTNAPDEVIPGLGFFYAHYFAAGSTLFGTEAKGVYEYTGKTYAGPNMHVNGFTTCIDCHDNHGLEVKEFTCKGCHQTDDPKDIRLNAANDYDGDGDTKEGIYYEIQTYIDRLYVALLENSVKVGTPIVYGANSYPYFFNDNNANGLADPDEIKFPNAFSSWTPRLFKGAYNYQYALNDPGAYAHNPKYFMQVLYDTIEDLGGDVKGLVRP